MKDSPWWIVGGNYLVSFGFRGFQPQIWGYFGCGVLVRVFLCCVVNVVTTIVIGIDLGMHDNCQQFYHNYIFLS
jgi:hypothetical protein